MSNLDQWAGDFIRKSPADHSLGQLIHDGLSAAQKDARACYETRPDTINAILVARMGRAFVEAGKPAGDARTRGELGGRGN